MSYEIVEATPGHVTQPLDRSQLDPKIDLRRDLVHMLAAWPGGASGANGDRARWDANGLGHDDRAHAHVPGATWSSKSPFIFAPETLPSDPDRTRRSHPRGAGLPAPPAGWTEPLVLPNGPRRPNACGGRRCR